MDNNYRRSCFYYQAGIYSFIILLISAFVNIILALLIRRCTKGTKALLLITIAANVGLLLYYKYLGFMSAIAPVNDTAGSDAVQEIIMPLGISFFTFQQIMYVVSVYRKEIETQERYAKLFPTHTGVPAKPLRMALGSLLIQKHMNFATIYTNKSTRTLKTA